MSLISTMFSDYAQGIRPAIGRDSALGVTQDFNPGDAGVTTLFQNVPCSYQEANARTSTFYAQRDALVSNEVYFSQDPGIQPNDLLIVTRFKTGDVIKLNVVGLSDPVQMGTTWVWKCACERIRQPN